MENLNVLLGIIASVLAIIGASGYVFIKIKSTNNKIKSGDNSTNVIGNNNKITKGKSDGR
ncbi:hypothetical protein [Lactococcus lactis]|uniref:hypothetical protein n=1 Tax=Lactococcus lactis TaxID=1358 RepID=UPI003D12AEB5